MLARKAIEMAVADRLEEDEVPNLKTAMTQLKDMGALPDYVSDWGEHVRALGNDAAHRFNFDEVEAKEAVEFAREFAMNLYTRPAYIKSARQKYNERQNITEISE